MTILVISAGVKLVQFYNILSRIAEKTDWVAKKRWWNSSEFRRRIYRFQSSNKTRRSRA